MRNQLVLCWSGNNIRAERKCQKQCFFCQENSKKRVPPPERLVASGDDFPTKNSIDEPLLGLNIQRLNVASGCIRRTFKRQLTKS